MAAQACRGGRGGTDEPAWRAPGKASREDAWRKAQRATGQRSDGTQDDEAGPSYVIAR